MGEREITGWGCRRARKTELSASENPLRASFSFYLAPSIQASADRFMMQVDRWRRWADRYRNSWKQGSEGGFQNLPPEVGRVAGTSVASALDATTERVIRWYRRRFRRLRRSCFFFARLSTKLFKKLHYQFILHTHTHTHRRDITHLLSEKTSRP